MAMETHDLTDDERVAAHRERVTAMLPEIAQQIREALAEQGIDTPLFLIVPRSGDAIITFGTSLDPSGDEWDRVGKIVSSIVRRMVGLDRTRCREVICATTHDHQPSGASVSRTPMPTPALQDSGAAR
jgi:hypothetical protein